MMCLSGRVSVRLDRGRPARREKMGDLAPEPDKRTCRLHREQSVPTRRRRRCRKATGAHSLVDAE
jgi:hypothetical protein